VATKELVVPKSMPTILLITRLDVATANDPCARIISSPVVAAEILRNLRDELHCG